MGTREIGGIYVRDMGPMKKGEIIKGHAHNFPHCSMCVSGSGRVDPCDMVNGELIVRPERGAVYVASGNPRCIEEVAWVNIPKGVYHQITALEDDTYWWCVYPADLVRGI